MEDFDDLISRLKKLDLRQLLSYWILNERKKAELYEILARKARELNLDDSAYDIFRVLSLEAVRHDRKLMSVYERTFKTRELRTVELPSLDFASILEKFEGSDDVLEILETALRLEELAGEVYEILTESATDEYMKAVFSYLGSTERLHRRTIESLITEYRYGHA
ncbi:ferritin family protein [Thermococcus sp.]